MREVTDAEGLTWTCAQAYAGLSETDEPGDPAEECDVVATPSGEAQSVRLRLRGDWRDRLDDDELLAQIRAASERQDAERHDARGAGAA